LNTCLMELAILSTVSKSGKDLPSPAIHNFFQYMHKPNITRTYGVIHFEDLAPERFEDLIRELVYDFRDWQSIEATGKGGGDDGCLKGL
jgi:hypothetical protein